MEYSMYILEIRVPDEAAEAALSWREPTGIRISKYRCIHEHTCTVTYQYILVCTSIYQYIPLPVLITSFQYVLVCTSICQYIHAWTGMYWYVLVCAGIYWYILLSFTSCSLRGAAVCAGHHCRDPSISLQHHRRYC